MCKINRKIEVALYGLGTETERFIQSNANELNIVGLLDGYKESGEQFGYPIISLQQAIDLKVERIIVVARPGSCKVIAKRIKDTCLSNGVEVFDVRGNNLLEEKQASLIRFAITLHDPGRATTIILSTLRSIACCKEIIG